MRIKIRLGGLQQLVTARKTVSPYFAIHRPFGKQTNWTVTHVPTGAAILHVRSDWEARTLVDLMLECEGIDYSSKEIAYFQSQAVMKKRTLKLIAFCKRARVEV
jgi:hypothetical protein